MSYRFAEAGFSIVAIVIAATLIGCAETADPESESPFQESSARLSSMNTQKIGSGRTPVGATNWQPYHGGTTGIYVDVDTRGAGFVGSPVYVASIAGRSNHWATTGGSAIYDPSSSGFRIYIRYSDGSPITPADANSNQWHITWMGGGQ
jgi:hypothetical protein